MKAVLNEDLSTLHTKVYRTDEETLEALTERKTDWSKRQFSGARDFFTDQFGIDTTPYPTILTPYAHCDAMQIIFTEEGDKLSGLDDGDENTRVRLQFSPGVLNEDGKFVYLVPDSFPLKDRREDALRDYHFKTLCQLKFKGLGPKENHGFVGAINNEHEGVSTYFASQVNDRVKDYIEVWREVLTDIRNNQNELEQGIGFYLNTGWGTSRCGLTGEFLSLILSPELDLPWMKDNALSILRDLYESDRFRTMLEMKSSILRSKPDGELKGKYEEFVTSHGELFRPDLFSEDVAGRITGVNDALTTLNESLDYQVQAAREEYSGKVSEFMREQRGNKDLTKFLQYI